jgi:hypothetical protein
MLLPTPIFCYLLVRARYKTSLPLVEFRHLLDMKDDCAEAGIALRLFCRSKVLVKPARHIRSDSAIRSKLDARSESIVSYVIQY